MRPNHRERYEILRGLRDDSTELSASCVLNNLRSAATKTSVCLVEIVNPLVVLLLIMGREKPSTLARKINKHGNNNNLSDRR